MAFDPTGGAGRTGRLALTAAAFVFLAVFLVVPLAVVFSEALAKGISAYRDALAVPDALAAVRLTLLGQSVAFSTSCDSLSLDGSTLIGRQTAVNLGAQPKHDLQIACP